MRYVSVLYLNEEAKTYTGRSYSYATNLPVRKLDRVLCPVGTKGEIKRACVIDDNVPIEMIPDDIVKILKVITEYDKGE